MGSSNVHSNGVREIDPKVGGLVWVRRRNGSWWPGVIVSLDEITKGSLVSPRSGTPVKLLGREDASIDWYNLEKSKRVKAFRCGEYDECIERAKASAAGVNRKAVKYARREDAILHALEIENALGRRNPPVSFKRRCTTGQSLNHVAASRLHVSRGKRGACDLREEGTENVKRMRGLKELGVRSREHIPNGGLLNSVRNCSGVLRKKRSQVAKVQELLKKKHRRRLLTKVLESAGTVPVPVTCEPSTAGSEFADQSSAATCDGDSTLLLEASDVISAERLLDVPCVLDGKCTPGFSSTAPCLTGRLMAGGSQEHTNQDPQSLDHCSNTGPDASRWQLKGKRNSRYAGKHKSLLSSTLPNREEEHAADVAGGEHGDKFLRLASCSGGSLSTLRDCKYKGREDPPLDVKPVQVWNWAHHDFRDSNIYDVELEVKTSNQRQNVPLISLVSKAAGKAVVGHPLIVERLGDMSTSDWTPRNQTAAENHNLCFGSSPKPGPASTVSAPAKTRKHGLLAKKTRRLSMLSGHNEDVRPAVGKADSPVIACVPLKLVFSRITEAVSGSAWKRHRTLAARGR